MNRFLRYLKEMKLGKKGAVLHSQRTRRARLCLERARGRRLLKALYRAKWMNCPEDEALRRLKQEAGRIEGCMRCAQAEGGVFLPMENGEVRVLQLARKMLAGGEMRLDRQRLMEGAADFDRRHELEMRELQAVPAAIYIALSEAFAGLGERICRSASQRCAARKWMERGGRIDRRAGDVFLEAALRLAAEAENPERHAQAVHAISRCGCGVHEMVNRVHAAAADDCLRLENLMAALHLMESLDWEKCFEALSAADAELREETGGVYGRMDAESKAEVRRIVAQTSERLDVPERMLVRIALQLADASAAEHGTGDPRSTVCWYLMEDAGRAELQRALGSGRRLPRRIPDVKGVRTVVWMSVGALLAAAVLGWMTGELVLLLYVPPIAWMASARIIERLYSRWVKPRRLLKLELSEVSELARTLVVLPVLLSGVERTREMIAHMEALGCLEKDENIDFLLLGDFRDAEQETMPEDAQIIAEARAGIAGLNERAERKKYYYLHRRRSWRGTDARWMGQNRKRGALMALNRLLLGQDGSENAFGAENEAARDLAGRYRYAVTLDADTEYLPGTIQTLVGTMLHPLNRVCCLGGRRRGYAVLQPNMELMPEADVNAYVHLMTGSGGVDGYPVSISNFYQDMTGYGCFAGKGIYDVKAFAEATENRLRDDAILSHDLIEGILSGAAYLNDVSFYDGCPADLQGELVRLHRWIRGDWQLLPVLCSRMRMAAADRLKLLSNLLRSLYMPALMGLLVHAVWMDKPEAFVLGLALGFLDPLLQLPRVEMRIWKRALLRLALLPVEAGYSMDAILRTLWRLAFTRRHLMDWVPAADAGGDGKQILVYSRIAVLLLLPGILRPFWIPAVLALAALFAVGPGWAEELRRRETEDEGRLDEEERELLQELARRTWRFFERYVPEGGNGLPPDNVQFDPPVGIAQRTSPTNIGLYLMSCMAAQELGFISGADMRARMEATIESLERMEKWNGQIYNWYDILSLEPMRPRYVSSVDSGNLAAALLLCAHGMMDMDAGLAARMQNLAEGMHLETLYDAGRGLFRIGMDVENGRMSDAHYDLYASESRLLSFAAMMLGMVPVRHWKKLSRAAVSLGGDRALLSWSGTMFEYLMPELLIKSCRHTLAGQSCRGVIRRQMRMAQALNRPWGVSESGYCAFDRQLNYQYRAFGLRELALNGNAVQDVVAPYASTLALAWSPADAAKNLKRMWEMGWGGEYGMYEAADYLHMDAGHRPRLVRSYMAHHQGMSLCALCNALHHDALSRRFMEIPRARALRLLLQEKEGGRVRIRREMEPVGKEARQERRLDDFARSAAPESWAAEGHLLHGGGTTALVNGRGASFLWKDRLQINRFSGDLQDVAEGMYIHLEGKKRCVLGQGGKVRFEAGCVRFRESFEGLELEMRVCVSPEDGTVYHTIEIENPGEEEKQIAVTGCMAVALADAGDMRAHPAFQNLFVETGRMENGALVFKRRMREPGGEAPELVFLVSGAEATEWETSLEKLVGRSGGLGMSDGIAQHFSGSTGYVLNPCAALRVPLHIGGGETRKLHFELCLTQRDVMEERIERMTDANAPERAMQLLAMQTLTMLGHAGITGEFYRLFQRMSVLLMDPKLRTGVLQDSGPATHGEKNDLWSAGISGDLPVLLVEIGDPEQINCLRTGVHMHGFYRMMGVRTDLVLINGKGCDYRQPVRGAVGDVLASSHLNGSYGAPGGVHVLEMQNLKPETLEMIRRAAAVHLEGGRELKPQLRAALDALRVDEHITYQPMEARGVCVPEKLEFFNGYGGFDGGDYVMELSKDLTPPAPWSNVLAGEKSGAVVTERGGGFAWFDNSRSKRLTPFKNDALREGWGWMFYLVDEREEKWIRLLPGDRPMTRFCVRHRPGMSSWQGYAQETAFDLRMHAEENGIQFDLSLKNEGREMKQLRLIAFVDWLMGTDAGDAVLLRSWSRRGACFARGASEGVGCFLSDEPRVRPGYDRQSFFDGGDCMQPRGLESPKGGQSGWSLQLALNLRPDEVRCCRFLLGWAEDEGRAYALARDFRSGGALRRSRENWQERLSAMRIETPDAAVNLLANGFLQAQLLNARIRGRTGLYQPGGAWGFRDQLQDMLPMIYLEPERVRRHLLYCAGRQFEAGDVLHWWHEPYTGVRTRISDDMLFLPYVTAQYVRITGDQSVLEEEVPFLEEIEIPEGREDVYAQMRPGAGIASLHVHCMRAFERSSRTGEHGLCLMGSGDWNDGMNRVGSRGRGESVWLSEFLAACAADYAEIAPDAADQAWLLELRERMRAAVEEHGWDGGWYLRAYTDEGEKLGSDECACCRIDAISQAWAVLAGLDSGRCQSAMDAAWRMLADEELQVIRLLAPPFDKGDMDPGYIAAYPPGVRENGAQYTHAACWMLAALAQQGDERRAHRTLEMLLPLNHARTRADAQRYRVEPYVMAGDIYTDGAHAGRGGWSWYTGSAAWMLMGVLRLLGFERRGNRVRMHALLGNWPEAEIEIRCGQSSYRLISRAGERQVQLDGMPVEGEFICMVDDGRRHIAVFPAREGNVSCE